MAQINSSEKIKVLYVDDESHNLVSFKATFRTRYKVLLANSAEEAFTIVAENPDIHVILSDQRMPKMTGAEFFNEIRKTHPAPIRMLISGYTDLTTITEGINRGNIFRYIQKPWHELDVQSAIEEGYNHYVTSQALSIRNEELHKAYQELDKFAYSVTHDLRGPIHSALGAMDLLKSVEDMGEMREMLALVERSLFKLDAFIENTHHYYSIRQGTPAAAEIDFNRMAHDFEDVYRLNGLSAGVRFETSIDQGAPFFSDRVCLTIILNNLLTNAFKYQRKEESSKFVWLDIESDDKQAIIRVTDNGIGIEKEYADKIFELFFRATTEATGSGFGLYNVKDALKKIDGVITVSSEKGKGSTFTLTIPNVGSASSSYSVSDFTQTTGLSEPAVAAA